MKLKEEIWASAAYWIWEASDKEEQEARDRKREASKDSFI